MYLWLNIGTLLLGELHALWVSPLWHSDKENWAFRSNLLLQAAFSSQGPKEIWNNPKAGTIHSTISSPLNVRSLCFPSYSFQNELCTVKWRHVPTWSLSLSWWPMIAVAWCGYFCFRCSRKASLFLSISDVCIPRISLELRGPPRVCLLGILREDLETETRLFPLERRSLVLRHSASSNDVTCRLLFPCSERQKEQNTVHN